jgi:serine/threonine protein kinase
LKLKLCIKYYGSPVDSSSDNLSSLYQFNNIPYYTAPEIIKEEFVDIKCDIWSAGVILYEMLTGKIPFKGSTFEEIHKNIHTGNFNLMEPEFQYVSIMAKNVVLNMLKINVQ